MPEPATFVSVVKEAQAAWSLFRHPIRRLGRRLGITNTPNIVASPMVSGALPDDARPTYRQGYFVTTVVNIQRQDWRTRWLTTKDAISCRGRVYVVSDAGRGHSIREDDVLFCGPAAAPRAQIDLSTDDDRFHIPLIATISDWAPHHLDSTRQLQPGTYLLGARYFTGLHDNERLPVGRYALHLTLISANGLLSNCPIDGGAYGVRCGICLSDRGLETFMSCRNTRQGSRNMITARAAARELRRDFLLAERRYEEFVSAAREW